MNQMTLPMNDGEPASGLSTIVRPNGHSAKPAIRNEAIPNGMVMIRMQAMMPGDDVGQEHPEAAQHQPDDVENEPHGQRA